MPWFALEKTSYSSDTAVGEQTVRLIISERLTQNNTGLHAASFACEGNLNPVWESWTPPVTMNTTIKRGNYRMYIAELLLLKKSHHK